MVMSAVSSVSTPGVLVTAMTRLRAVSRSMLSTPVPKLAMSRRLGPAWLMTARSILSVTVGTSTSAILTASTSCGLRHRLVVDVQPGVEQLAHAGLDDVRQLARDDDDGLPGTGGHGFSAAGQTLMGDGVRWISRPGQAGAPSGQLRLCLTEGHGDDKVVDRLGLECPKLQSRTLTKVQSGLTVAAAPPGPWLAGRRGMRAECELRKLVRRLRKLALAMGRVWPLTPAPSGAAEPAAAPPAAAGSGLTVPRFVSLKSDRVNLRAGPGTEYPASWVFRRAGLPVEIIKEFEAWRQVRDADGVDGLGTAELPLRPAHGAGAALGGEAGPAAAANTDPHQRQRERRGPRPSSKPASSPTSTHCDGRWCEVSVEAVHGYIEQKKLWGVYEGEVVK